MEGPGAASEVHSCDLCVDRALSLNEAGTLCVSGSTDHTIKVWDVGQQRCISTLAVHEDSVWAVAMDADFGTVTSGGRDGCIYRWAITCTAGSQHFGL